jgi:pimeloyl-ACP methyl ester carboxylesterase
MTEHHSIAINGVQYHVAVSGEAVAGTALLLHGMPDTGAIWDSLTEVLLQHGYRVVVPDMLGYGRTDKPSDPNRYAGELVISDLITLIECLELPPCHIIGHDWGAYASWELVTHLPDQFLRHVAVSMSHPSVFFSNLNLDSLRDNWYMYLNTQEAAVDLYTLDNCAFFREFIGSTHPNLDEVCSRLVEPDAMRANLNWDRGNPLAKSYVVARAGKLNYPKVNVPTLGLWSPGDVYLLEAHMQASGDYVDSDWRYERLSSGSHWCMLDNPDETNAAILNWLTEPQH